jgi:hypothetical protein
MKKYDDFFEEMNGFFKKRDLQKMRGLNDYNILTAVLNPWDEERLHSRMIASFLNIYGWHYQKSLFLELFLESLKLDDFDIDINSAWVKNEHLKIDIHISDEKKHIIIENKINAEDQPKQIRRYVKEIYKNYQNISDKDILVIYLTKDREVPSDNSLGDWKISDNTIIDKNGNKKAIYRNMHYKTDVLKWLEKCKKEVQNITNLNMAFEQYIQVVQMVANQYKGKVMSLENKINNEKNYQIAREIYWNFDNIRENKFYTFFEEVCRILQDKLPEWEIRIDYEKLKKPWGTPFQIYKKSWVQKNDKYVYFGFEFREKNYYSAGFGLVKIDYKITIDRDSEYLINADKELLESLVIDGNHWWLFVDTSSYKGDFIEKIISREVTPEKLSEQIVAIIKKYEPLEKDGLITAINNSLIDKAE